MCWDKHFSCLLVVLMAILETGQCYSYTSIQWDPMNPIFTTRQKHNKPTAYKAVKMSSKINIICPNTEITPVQLNEQRQKDSLYENLWIVDKTAFNSCRINLSNPHNQLLLNCNKPKELNTRLVTFKTVSPIYGDLEFKYGMDYYFIATSNGTENSLNNSEGGHCKTHNMRLHIYICSEQHQNDPRCRIKETEKREESKGNSSTPTTKNHDDVKGKTGKSTKCFLAVKDKIWLITVGVVVGTLLALSLGCLVVTCFRKRNTKSSCNDEGNGKISLTEKNASSPI